MTLEVSGTVVGIEADKRNATWTRVRVRFSTLFDGDGKNAVVIRDVKIDVADKITASRLRYGATVRATIEFEGA